MTVFVIVSALTFVLYLQTGAYMLWKNPQSPFNRWFFSICLYLAALSLANILLLNEGTEGIQTDFIRKSGWGILFMLFFRFHSLLTGYPRNRLFYDILSFFFIVFGAGLSLFLLAVLFSFEPERLYLLEDWFWTNQFVDMVYYLVMLVFLVSMALMYKHWRKGILWKNEKRRFLIVFLFFTIVGPAIIMLGNIRPDNALISFVRMPHVYVLPWFIGVSYGFVHYRFLPQDPAKASRKLLLEFKQFLLFCDRQGAVFETNPYSIELIGKRKSEIKESNIRHLFVDISKVEKLIQNAINDGNSGPKMITLRTQNGDGIPLLLFATLLIDRFGDHYGIALYGTDQRDAIALKEEIKKRKMIEASLEAMGGSLESEVEKHTEAFKTSLKETSLKIIERQKAEERIKAEIADMEIMIGEIQTRVKKNIGMILTLLQQANQELKPSNSIIREKILFQRINTILLVNQQVQTDENYGMVQFNSFLESLIRVYKESWKEGNDLNFRLNADPLMLWVDQATPLAMVANELISNVILHAYSDKSPHSDATVDVSCSFDEGKYCLLNVKDNGKGFNPEALHDGGHKGLQLARILVEDQLGGTYTMVQNDGLQVAVSFPLDQSRQGHLGISS